MVVKTGGRFVFAFHSNDGRDDAVLFQFAVSEADLLEKVDSNLLHPAYVVRVVRDPYLVGLVVIDMVHIGFHIG